MIFQAVALVILAGFYGCYFWKMLCQRRQGIRTDQLGRGKAGRVLAIELALKVVSWLVVAAEVVGVLSDVHIGPLWMRILGAVFGAAGVLVFALSVAQMGDSWRAGVAEDERTELVTTGIYRLSRNPAFLGFDLTYLGLALMFWSWPLAALSALAGLLLHLQIVVVEEPFLAAAFGEAYLSYRRRTSRYLGRRKGGAL